MEINDAFQRPDSINGINCGAASKAFDGRVGRIAFKRRRATEDGAGTSAGDRFRVTGGDVVVLIVSVVIVLVIPRRAVGVVDVVDDIVVLKDLLFPGFDDVARQEAATRRTWLHLR